MHKKILVYLFIGLLVYSFVIFPAFAQEATDSAQIATQSAIDSSPTATPTPSPVTTVTSSQENPFSEQGSQAPGTPSQGSVLQQSLQQSLSPVPQHTSAFIKQPMDVQPLAKKTFQATEEVSLTVSNATAQGIQVSVLDHNGKAVDTIPVTKVDNGTSVTVTLRPPSSAFTPGKYTLQISDASGIISQQDFTWGVLAINPDKSIYLPNDTAEIAMAVLDNAGEMVCDASVTLQIQNPNSQITTLSTTDGGIAVTSQCKSHEVSSIPDYQANYQVGGVGDYTLTLTAVTKNGSYTIQDGFQVQSSVPFILERHAPTRIYPINAYPVSLDITPEQDFTGTIKEYVPAGFTITPLPGSDSSFSQQLITTHGADTLSAGYLSMPYAGNYKMTQGFGVEVTDPEEKALYTQYGLKGHDGIDFGVPLNTKVVAADSGKVILAGNGAYGLTIVIQHTWGRSYYGHLNTISVKVGQLVGRGDMLGLSGNTGLSTGEHLHFGIRPNNPDMSNGYFGKIDPTAYLAFPHKSTHILAAVSSFSADWKEIDWQVSLKKGQKITLGYTFQAPPQSPQFYTLGPLQFFYEDSGFLFGEIRQWEIASDATNTYYMTSTAGSSPYPTTSWTYATAANASSNTNTFAENKKSTGFYMFQPGATNTTSLGSTASSLPSSVTNTGWIYTGTNLDGLQTDAGTWTINYKYSVVYTSAPTTKILWYRVLKVTCTSGSCTSGAVISPTDASAPSGSGWAQSGIGTLPSSGVLSGAQSLTFSGSLTQFASGDKLYVEFAIQTVSTGSNSGGWHLEANTSSDNVVTSNVSTPPPVVNQVHYRWRNDDGSETAATWRRVEDTSDNKNYSNGNIRLRVEASNKTGGSAATSYTYQLQYGLESGGLGNCTGVSSWTAVPTSGSTDFNISSSSFVTDATATTAQLTADSTNFVAGQVKTTGNTTSGITLAKTTDYTEVEYSIQPAATPANLGNAYCFRLTNGGSTTNFTYTVYPELIVGQPTINQEHFRFRNDDGRETTTTGQVTYLSPTSDTIAGVFTPTGCTSHYDCLNDNASNAGSSGSAPTNDGATTTLAMAAGTERYGLNLSSLPTGYTITGLTVTAYAIDQGNPNTNVTIGYCVTCGGSDDTMGTAHNISVGSYTAYSDTFSSLSLTGNVGLVLTADSAKASVSTFYVQVTYTAPAATWKAAEDTAITNVHTDRTFRLRMEVANTSVVSGTRNYKLQYATYAGGVCGSYADIPASATTEPFEMTTSSYFSNSDPTTAQLTATGSFETGSMVENPSTTTGAITMNGTSYTEYEFMLHITSNAAALTTYCFQLADTSLGALDTYSQTPMLTTGLPDPTLSQLLRHGQWFYSGLASPSQPFTF